MGLNCPVVFTSEPDRLTTLDAEIKLIYRLARILYFGGESITVDA